MSKEKFSITLPQNKFQKFFNFIKKIFGKNKTIKSSNTTPSPKTDESFINRLQKHHLEEKKIQTVLEDISILYTMSFEELQDLNKTIQKHQEYLNQRITELKLK